jgi:hypothetical protein
MSLLAVKEDVTMRSFFRLLWPNRSTRERGCCRHPLTYIPRVDLLEDRLVPSGTVTVSTTADQVDGNVSSIAALLASPGGDGKISLREAIEAANNTPSTALSPNFINIPDGHYVLTAGELPVGTLAGVSVVNQATRITGTSQAGTILDTTTAGSRIFNLDNTRTGGVSVAIMSMTIEHGSPLTTGGGAILAGGPGDATTVSGITFLNNSSGVAGGAVQSLGGSLTVTSCNFNSNSSSGSGGAINFGSMSTSAGIPDVLTVTGSNFSGNVSSATGHGGGGAIAVALQSAGALATFGTLTVTGSNFNGNMVTSGGADGGGAIWAPGANVAITSSQFTSNQLMQPPAGGATDSGGAIYVDGGAGGTFTIQGNRFSGNSAPVASGSHGMTIYNKSGGAGSSVDDNWWLSNTGPTPIDVSGVILNSFLKLQVAPVTVAAGSSATVTAGFATDSQGNPVAGANLAVLAGLPVSFGGNTAAGSTLTGAQTTIQANGQATATYNAGPAGGSDTVTATVDGVQAQGTVAVQQAPQVTTQPTNQTTSPGGSASFIAHAAVGTPAPTVQWYVNTGSGFTPLANGPIYGGVTTDTLTITGAAAAMNGYRYEAVYSNGVSPNATSNAATLTVSNSALHITTTTLPTYWTAGATGYHQTIAAAGGTGTITWTVTAGSTPTGLSLDPHSGLLSGTPTAAGTYRFTVTARDSTNATTSQAYTVVILPSAFFYDLATKALTITGTTFTYQQTTTADASGTHTTYIFTIDGVTQPLFDVAVAHVQVNGPGAGGSAYLYTGDTYTGTDHQVHETLEEVVIGAGGYGQLYKVNASGNGTLFMQLAGFTTEYASMGHADSGLILGTAGVQNTFVSSGGTAYMISGSASYTIAGALYVYGYAVNPYDVAYHSDGSGPSALVMSGTAYSFMLGTDNGQSFFNEAVGFHTNYGIAHHAGQDTAFFYDSPNSDVFSGTAGGSYMYSDNPDGTFAEFDEATGFAQVYAYSFVGGTDYAYNYDPAHNHVTGFTLLT